MKRAQFFDSNDSISFSSFLVISFIDDPFYERRQRRNMISSQNIDIFFSLPSSEEVFSHFSIEAKKDTYPLSSFTTTSSNKTTFPMRGKKSIPLLSSSSSSIHLDLNLTIDALLISIYLLTDAVVVVDKEMLDYHWKKE